MPTSVKIDLAVILVCLVAVIVNAVLCARWQRRGYESALRKIRGRR